MSMMKTWERKKSLGMMNLDLAMIDIAGEGAGLLKAKVTLFLIFHRMFQISLKIVYFKNENTLNLNLFIL